MNEKLYHFSLVSEIPDQKRKAFFEALSGYAPDRYAIARRSASPTKQAIDVPEDSYSALYRLVYEFEEETT